MDKKALVIGLGISGRASVEFLLQKGFQIVAVDAKAKSLASDSEVQRFRSLGVEVYLDSYPIDFSLVQLVVPSPGVPPTHPLFAKAASLQIEIIGEAELAFRHMKQKAVAISGTNGKTTVTLLVEHILNASGYKARALGNVGTPLTKYFLEPDPNEIVIAELSSYQLETMQTAVFDSAVILNITPDHLDRYTSMDEYAEAKARLQYCVKEPSSLYLFSRIAEEYPHLFRRSFTTFGSVNSASIRIKDGSILQNEAVEYLLPVGYREKGMHDCLNALAAWILCRDLGVRTEQFLQHLQTFRKPSHRIEFVRSIRGVQYFDDSKGTNIDAVIQAVGAMKGPVVLIAGGVDKGSSYLPWIESFSGKVKQILAIGQASEKIQRELGLFFNVKIVDSLAIAVDEASALALPGD